MLGRINAIVLYLSPMPLFFRLISFNRWKFLKIFLKLVERWCHDRKLLSREKGMQPSRDDVDYCRYI